MSIEAKAPAPVETGTNLTPVFVAWYADVDDALDYNDHEHIVEVFDEFLIITCGQSPDLWLQPFVFSEISGRTVWGPRYRVAVEYMYSEGGAVVDKLLEPENVMALSRPISGKVCVITDLSSGETITNVTEGFVEREAVSVLIDKIRAGWDDLD